MLSGAAVSLAATFLDEHIAAVNGAGWSGEKIEAGAAPKSLRESESGPAPKESEESENSLEGLVDVVLTTPTARRVTIRESFARYFGLPTGADDLGVMQVSMPPDGNTTRSVYVRRRDSGEVDIFFIVVTRGEGSKFYQVSSSGEFIKAAHANGRITEISREDAREAFESERTRWRSWARDAGGGGGR